MIRSIFNKTMTVISTAAILLTIGCEMDSTNADTEMGSMEVRLHDAPGNYEEVNVFVESVQINRTESDEGWVTINEPNQQYNLLELTNGAYEVIGEAVLEAGTYNQMRLILSREDNNVVIAGEEHDLFIPSGSQTGIKLNINAEIQDDITYVLLLDFDADRSVVKTGNDASPVNYLLKPVIRASNEAETGNIDGIVSPVDAKAAVYAINDTDTLSTTYANVESGEFRLVGLEEGSYTVSVEASEEGYETTNIEDVAVIVGETSDIGVIELETSTE